MVVLAFVRVAEQHWREGTTELGLALLLGAVLRVLCPEHAVGLLAVRERRADVVALETTDDPEALVALQRELAVRAADRGADPHPTW